MADGWFEEYPSGYVLNRELEVNLFIAPDNLVPQETPCLLKKGRFFHPGSINVSEKYVTVSGSDIYVIDHDFQQYKDGITYAKGTIVVELAQMSEGVCFVEIDGVVSAETCPSELEGFKLIAKSLIEPYRIIKTMCDNGPIGWILESSLSDYSGDSDPDATVQILSEDEFVERGWVEFY